MQSSGAENLITLHILFSSKVQLSQKWKRIFNFN